MPHPRLEPDEIAVGNLLPLPVSRRLLAQDRSRAEIPETGAADLQKVEIR